MNKIAKLTKEIEELKKQRQQAEDFIKQADAQCAQNYREIVHSYQDFYDRKTSKEFILYDRFPSIEALELYVRSFDRFPLHDNGVLNVKELAEIIKHIYQFRTGQEYDILTLGVTEQHGEAVYGGQAFTTKPHLFFMIGNERRLSPYQEFNGKFINDDRLHSKLYLYAKGKDLINIELDRAWSSRDIRLDIECFTGDPTDEMGMINYYDAEYNRYTSFNGSAQKQLFSQHIMSNLSYYSNKVKGIKDVFDFAIHHMDSYIAKVLVSIIIYKRNNNIEELTEDDYNHIFGVLFGEKVSIKDSVAKDFPKQLIYVPNKQSGR